MKREPITVCQAVQLLMDHCHRLETEKVSLEEAYGRILRESIIARHDVPPFDRSPYDGYAIRAVDSKGASPSNPIAFRVIGELGAGHIGDEPLQRYEAYRIMTGALLPRNADAVVMLEEAEDVEEGFIIKRSFAKHENISFQGEDAKKGEKLIPEGSFIHPGTVALLATFGYRTVTVGKRPKVSIIATGTELLEVDEPLQPGKIRNSNGPMLQAQLQRMNIPFQSLGIIEDDLEASIEMVKEALRQSDIVITTGGVSVGDFDYLPVIYERLGAKVLFDKVMMRPGSVTTVAVLDDKLLFGLSGNPSACFTGFELFTRPAIIKMMGGTAPFLPRMKAKLGEDLQKRNPFTRFIRAVWEMTASGPVVVSAGFNKSNAVSSIARGNCFIVLPKDSEGHRAGREVDILLLGQEQGVQTFLKHI